MIKVLEIITKVACLLIQSSLLASVVWSFFVCFGELLFLRKISPENGRRFQVFLFLFAITIFWRIWW